MASGENYFPRSQGILTFSSKRVTSSNCFGTKSLGIEVSGAFDIGKLCEGITAWQKRILNRAGLYVRAKMKNSMKEGKYGIDKKQLEEQIANYTEEEIVTEQITGIRMVKDKKTGQMRQDKRFNTTRTRRVSRDIINKLKATLPRRKIHSNPGKPPVYWDRSIKDSIFFFVDPRRATVIIGPQQLNKRGNALEVLEFGGQAPLPQGGSVYVAPRPYVAPAQEAGEKFLQKLLREL